jgi:hypothetical protein
VAKERNLVEKLMYRRHPGGCPDGILPSENSNYMQRQDAGVTPPKSLQNFTKICKPFRYN